MSGSIVRFSSGTYSSTHCRVPAVPDDIAVFEGRKMRAVMFHLSVSDTQFCRKPHLPASVPVPGLSVNSAADDARERGVVSAAHRRQPRSAACTLTIIQP